ncbi:MAG TPA: PIN domain-containing protein [Steroidobacteraceae bacterium]
MILVDTSVWIDHFRQGLPELAESLRRREVVMHPYIVGELACGNFSNRQATLELLQQLRSVGVAEHDEVMNFIRVRRLHGRGIGYVDVHLLAAATIAGYRLWTVDKRLNSVASSLGVAC